MSIQILIKGHSTNGKAKTIASYYNSKNVDTVNVLPKDINDLSFFELDDRFNKHFTLYVYVSGSKSEMNFEFINQCINLDGAKYKTSSFINMLNCINNK